MSSFWDKKLGNASTPAAPEVRQTVSESNRPWWQQETPPPAQPLAQQDLAGRPVENVQVQSDEFLGKNAKLSSTKTSAAGYCPECGSGNYMKPQGMATVAPRCFDCGYPRLQSTSGMGSVANTDGKPARAARQLSTASDYNPHHIVGRIE